MAPFGVGFPAMGDGVAGGVIVEEEAVVSRDYKIFHAGVTKPANGSPNPHQLFVKVAQAEPFLSRLVDGIGVHHHKAGSGDRFANPPHIFVEHVVN
jgi:hypothetical protein